MLDTEQDYLERTNSMRILKSSGKSYKEIAILYGVSRQRVQQLLKPPQDIQDKIKLIGKCEKCGMVTNILHIHHKNYTDSDINNYNYLCIKCHRAVGKKQYYCHECGKLIIGKQNAYCDDRCRNAYNEVTLVCETCGKHFKRKYNAVKWNIIRQNPIRFFCSKWCKSKWLSDNYFIIHTNVKPRPHNTYKMLRRRKSKYDAYLPIIKTRIDNHEHLSEILKSLNLPIWVTWFRHRLSLLTS